MRALQDTGTLTGLAGDEPGSTVLLERFQCPSVRKRRNCLQEDLFLMRALQDTGTLTGLAGDEPGSTVFLEQMSVSQCPETRNCL